VLYVSPRLIPHVSPQARGWFSQSNPFNWDIANFRVAPDIRRFDNGTPGVMAALASVSAMEWHAAQDHAALLAHNRALTAQLIEMVDTLGLTLVTPRDPARRGGSIMALLPASHPAPGVIAALRAQGIAADARGQLLRLSPGIMTSEAGVTRLGKALAGMGLAPIK
jgi:kynureninase